MTFMVIQKYVNLSRLMAVVAFSAIGFILCGTGILPVSKNSKNCDHQINSLWNRHLACFLAISKIN